MLFAHPLPLRGRGLGRGIPLLYIIMRPLRGRSMKKISNFISSFILIANCELLPRHLKNFHINRYVKLDGLKLAGGVLLAIHGYINDEREQDPFNGPVFAEIVCDLRFFSPDDAERDLFL
jgi:hypothetical protein